MSDESVSTRRRPLPPPPPQPEDRVDDFGWITRGPSRRALKKVNPAAQHEHAEKQAEDYRSNRPKPRPLPPPPPQPDDPDVRGPAAGASKQRIRPA